MNLILGITTYNSISTCEKHLNIWKRYSNFVDKVIICEDSSTDGTWDYLNKQFLNEDNFYLIKTNINSGRPSVPRNLILSCLDVRDRVVFLDCDDLLPVEYLSLLQRLDDNIVYSLTKLSCIDPIKTFSHYPPKQIKVNTIPAYQLQFKNMITFSGCSFVRKNIENTVFVNEPLEDWKFWIQISKNYDLKFKKISLPCFYSSVPSLSPNKIKQIMRVYKTVGVFRLHIYFLLTVYLRVQEYYFAKKVYNLRNG